METAQFTSRTAWFKINGGSMQLRVSVLTLGAAVCLGVWVGCTEKIVESDRPIYENPPAAAAGFLGYSRQQQNLTACGNCHVGVQALWENRDADNLPQGHARAWAGLAESGHAEESCEDCHVTGAKGNAATSGGWADTKDSRYHDVQCESCHGSGLQHVMLPEINSMSASIAVASDPAVNCADCHQGAHHGFVDEWELSRHAKEPASFMNKAPCEDCHNAQGALDSFGVDSNYLEKHSGDKLSIVCSVCHDSHGSEHPANLRFALTPASREQNLCIKCHHRQAEPDTTGNLRSPHSPEGPLVLGERAGWWPPGFAQDVDKIRGSHGSDLNERLCASCHVLNQTITDDEGGFLVKSTGHLFKAIPCEDEQGIPQPDTDCDVSMRSFMSCASSSCHADEEAAMTAYSVTTQDILRRADELESLLNRVPEEALDPDSGEFTVAKGAWFNVQLARKKGSPTHNPFLLRGILNASKDAVEEEYNLKPGPAGTHQ